jgi:hypothetical protein
MTTATSNRNGTFPCDPRGAALYYIAHGMAPIPVPDRTKVPVLTGWPGLRVTADTLDEHFPAGGRANLGLLTGRLRDGAAGEVVVDLDCTEALRAADRILPWTARQAGRPGAPRSHRHYLTDSPPDKAHDKYVDPLRERGKDYRSVLVEVLSTGAQVIAPPSIHPTGEAYQWYSFGEPARVPIDGLLAAVRRLAAAALLGRYWSKGDRHDAALALSGGLLRAGWVVERVKEFLEAVCAAAQDEEATDRVRAVTDSAEKQAADEHFTGWPALAKVVGNEVVAKVREWLGVRSDRPAVATATPPTVREIESYKSFPVVAFPEPIRAYVSQGALALGCDPAYLALPALAVAASAIGNTRTIRLKRGWEEPAIVWSAIVGDSGTLKSPAYRRGDDLHTLTARTLLGTTAVTKADRQLAKAVNFGLLYGMGARGFRRYARSNYGIELTDDQAEQYRRAFFTAYPALRRWHNTVGRTQDRPIETRTLAGRRCRNVARFNEKLNLGIQGTGADGLKAALALLWVRRAECPGAVPVLAVHDEIVVECDAGTADAAAGWLKQAMLDGMAPLVAPVPVEVEVSVALTWGG